ncbi:MAG: UbiA family prenyltransferase [Sphingomonadales bacterium]|jgi:4-hydroxybenzoate polyprenyltransferase
MTGLSRKKWIKLTLLLGAVRWYNVLLLTAAQYILAFFIFGENREFEKVLWDRKLHLIVLANAFTVAGAFLINVFYDADKDLVNRSKFATLYRLIGQEYVLNTYVAFSVFAVLLALLASLKVFMFMAVFVFTAWFYSHKLQKIPFIREVSASLLAMAPLFSVWLHFGEMNAGLLLYLGSLFMLAFTREVIKDLQGNKGNIIFGYTTMVVITGAGFARKWLLAVNVLLLSLWFLGNANFNHGMGFYSMVSLISAGLSFLVSAIVGSTSGSQSLHSADAILKAGIVIHLLSPVVVVWM